MSNSTSGGGAKRTVERKAGRINGDETMKYTCIHCNAVPVARHRSCCLDCRVIRHRITVAVWRGTDHEKAVKNATRTRGICQTHGTPAWSQPLRNSWRP